MIKHKPVIALGGNPGVGKSTIARTFVSHFFAESSHIVSGDHLRKLLLKEHDPSYHYPDPVPNTPAANNNNFNELLATKFIEETKRIAVSGEIPIVHSGFTTQKFRVAFKDSIQPFQIIGIWLTANPEIIKKRILNRTLSNTTHSTADIKTLKSIYERNAKKPDDWTEISTSSGSPIDACRKIIKLIPLS